MNGKRQEFFQGRASVNTQLHRLPILSQEVWVWHVAHGEILRDIKDSEIASLQEEGWELFDPVDAPFPFLALISQLADTQAVLPAGTNSIKTLVKRDSISSAELAPVILAFRLPPTEQPPPFPSTTEQLARLGELGLIVEKDRFHMYTLDLLGDEGRQASQSMREAVRIVMSSPQSSAFPDGSWFEAQQGARHLAQLYWEAHVLSQAGNNSQKKAPRLSHPTKLKQRTNLPPPSPTIIAQNLVSVPIIADYITQKLLRALLDADDYVQYPEQMIAIHQPGRSDNGDIRIAIQPGSGEEWRHVLASLDALGDEVADTFCAVLALAIDKNSISELNKPFLLDPDDILRVCQRKMSNGTYTPLQRAHTVRYLQTIARIHVTAKKPGATQKHDEIQTGKPRRRRRKKLGSSDDTFFGIDSPVLLLGTVFGEYKTITGEALWEQREIILGGWTQRATSLLPQTASMLRQVLAYHSLRERHAKRLGRYITLQCFNNQITQNSGMIECSMQELLDQAGIKSSDHNPARVKDAIEKALDRLQKDNIIGSYSKVIEGDSSVTQEAEKRITQYAHGWWSLYTAQIIRIEPPRPSLDEDVFLLQPGQE